MRAEIDAVELLDDVLELVRDELLRCRRDGAMSMTAERWPFALRVIRVVARMSEPETAVDRETNRQRRLCGNAHALAAERRRVAQHRLDERPIHRRHDEIRRRRELSRNGFGRDVLMNRREARRAAVRMRNSIVRSWDRSCSRTRARHQSERRHIVAWSRSWTLDAAFRAIVARALHSVIRARAPRGYRM